MGLMYSISATNQAIAAAGDMLEVIAPSDAAVVLHRLWIEQRSEAGDAESEQIVVSLKRAVGATSGSGGSAVTPRALVGGAPAAGSTAEANNTTDMTGGTITVLMARAFNVHNGIEVVFTPEERPEIPPSGTFLITLDVSPADSVTFDYGVVIEEVGG